MLQNLFAGISIGSIYALIGLGFVITINGVGILNMAHGEILMLGGFLAVTFTTALDLPLFWGYLLALVCMTVFGYILNLAVLRPMINKPIFTVMIATIGLSMVLQCFAMNIWGPYAVELKGPFGNKTLDLGGVVIPYQYLLLIAALVVVCVLLWRKAGSGRLPLVSRLACVVGCLLCLIPILQPTRLGWFGVKTDVWDQTGAYRTNGSLATFLRNTEFMEVEEPTEQITIGEEPVDLDGLNYLAGKTMDFVNKSAMNGTILAHTDGQVPNLKVTIPAQDEKSLGQLFYMYEFACGVSGYILGVNPFNQPGVESYKKNMFALLGKPGYEKEREELLKRL